MTLSATQLQSRATTVVVRMKAECLRQGRRDEAAIADRLIRAIKALPAYELAEAAVLEVGETGLPAAVIRRLGEGKK